MFPEPPAWARRLLRFCCNRQLLESIDGDLNELFQERLLTHGTRYARRAYALDVVRSIAPYPMQYLRFARRPADDRDILRSYRQAVWRKWGKNRLYSTLNLVEMSVACALCLSG